MTEPSAAAGHRPLVLTVCLGNICRSPTAEAAIREVAAERGVDVEVRSAGTGDWHVGAPPDERMTAAAAAVDLVLDGAAEQVTAQHLADADLVVAMDRTNLGDLERLAERCGADTPIRLLRAYDPDSVASGELEVPDPYYGGPQGFEHVVSLCRAAAVGVVDHLTGERDDPGPR
ncbi:low molecular weight protein-tyrosine-phosphatase [Egicoccus halophilus]|uniref:protein-tyrosine-phosphatase n=1 Tax=Egicoccus halophilus TaxID=1670830 RepID=A0A8J3AB07_9ACTN|nr:low molecular weight protein-tyrosine-phosphatase [Egicoccus halophilus]GGI07131.1 low molecular weight protein-tyrosine-phosphatase [Egicoccus halophilus]